MARVLVVDDVDTYRDYLELELTEAGYEVRTAKNGHDAVEIGRSFHPDVLVVDWMLKNNYDGLEVATSMRESSPSVKTILITGYPSLELRRKAREAHIARFVKKPFTLADMVDTVGDVLAAPTS